SLTPAVREVLGNLKAVEQLVVLEGDPRALDFPAQEYEALLAGARAHVPDLAGLDEDAPLALFHTSGGAARPRGVVLSHRTLALHALYAVIAMGLREEDVSLCSVPFSYMNGGGNPQVNPAVAATSVLARRNDPEALLRTIARERVSVWITSPVVLARLLACPELTRAACESLRLVLVGGAPIAEATVRAAEERLGARCVSVYGLTETSPFITAAFPKRDLPREAWPACQATAGLPVLGAEVAVVDEEGREVPHDAETVGEILVRGNGVMTGYFRDPEATQRALQGGWLRTGDLATVDGQGYLTLRGRTTDEIVVSGMRVSASEIEAALASHPDVERCSVIAAPDPERGEAPVAVVVLRAGGRASEADLLLHAGGRLARFKVPRSIEFAPSLPTTESGEVVKSELRTLYAS
ncbi:MAG TPA: AMP-binding protein, partial [Vicinamibacteria bacterium]|nr:AMP-binding protein [Vicinamibacteria bacterium]